MFGSSNKVKIDPDLLARVKKAAEVAGFASPEEFIHYVLERELNQIDGGGGMEGKSDEEIAKAMKGLGYIS